MRQQQNNKNRMRGRGRNKPSNSLNRNYESNGPDVKIRGNAAHIAEKYTTLARDAQSSGDSVIAENYLQHAEHYNRIVLAAQAQREEAQANRARQNDAAQDEQPDVNDGGRAEAAAGNQEDDGEDGGRKQDSRRGRNGRAPRKREAAEDDNAAVEATDGDASEATAEANGSGSDAGDDGADEAPKKPARPRRTTRSKPQPADGMTEDAASLPQGLLGNGAGQTVGAEE